MDAQEGHRRRDPESHKSRSSRLHNGHKEHKEHKEPRENREHRRHGHNHNHNSKSERSDADGFRGGAPRYGYGADVGAEKERPDRAERHSARHGDRTSERHTERNSDRPPEHRNGGAGAGAGERHPERYAERGGGGDQRHREERHREERQREERHREERDERGDYSRPPLHIVQRSGGGGGGGGGGGNGAAGGQVKIFGASTHRTKAPAEGGAQGGGAASDAARKKPQFAVPEPPPPFLRCRFMDNEWHICHDAVNRSLLEQSSDFTVVACVGAQGVGKSTALSLLFSSFLGQVAKGEHAAARGGGSSGGGVRGASEPREEASFEAPLPVHSFRSFLEGKALEPGVELCVSRLDRLLLLDVQPLLCCDTDPDAELQSEIYLLLFLASICHTLLLVTDTPMDLQLCRLLRLMATLKGKVPDLATWIEQHGGDEGAAGERRGGAAEQYLQQEVVLPKLVVAFNHVAPEMEEDELCDPIRAFLQQSPWKSAPSVRFTRIPTLPGTSQSSMLTSEAARKAGICLRQRLLPSSSERGRFGRQHALQLTEGEWLHHVAGYWDFVQGAGVVQDYFDPGLRVGAACASRSSS